MDIEQFKKLVKEEQYEQAKLLAQAEWTRLAANPVIDDAPKTLALNEFIHAVDRKRRTESANRVIDAYRK